MTCEVIVHGIVDALRQDAKGLAGAPSGSCPTGSVPVTSGKPRRSKTGRAVPGRHLAAEVMELPEALHHMQGPGGFQARVLHAANECR